MKKILLYLLLLCSISTFAQAEFPEGIQVTNVQDNTALKVNVQNATGVINWKYLTDFQKEKAVLSTGLIKNGLISANGDPTKINITAGIGIISNFDDPENPTSTIVNFPAFTGITPTYLLTGTITYVAINNAAAVVMQATPFTPEQRRSLIVLGAVVHSNLTTINVINNISAPTNASTNQLHDFIEAVGALNLTGNKYTANGANLQLNKSAGLIFKLGSNFANDWKKPHELAQTAGTSLTFRYRTQNGTEGSDRINLDPALYDLNNVLTAVPNNKFTIQTVTMFQSGVTRIQYGQNVYDDLATAKNAVFTRNFVLEPNSKENGIIRAYIIMKNTTTSLQNVADADILEAQKFGGIASGGGGVALTLANIVTALGFTPENTANKQNSLAVDGTGTKYATVDAVSEATAYKRTIAQIRALTGVLPNNNFYTTDLGQEGNWYYDKTDTTSADNTGTILVTADGKRIKRVFSEVVNVKWFGVVSDFNGTSGTDNYLNFIKALSLQKRVFIPAGKYAISNSILLAEISNIEIIGEEGTELYCNNNMIQGTDTNSMLDIRNSKNVKISNIDFYGRRSFMSPAVVDWTNYIHSLNINTSETVSINNCRSFDSSSMSFSIFNVTKKVNISKCLSDNAMYHGVFVKNSSNLTIDGNIINAYSIVTANPAIGGIGVLVTLSNYVEIKNNYIKNTADTGTKTEGCNFVLYENNVVENSGKDGIKVMGYFGGFETVSHAKIIGNTVNGLFSGRSDGSSLITTQGVSDVIIANNSVLGTKVAGGTLEDGIRCIKATASIFQDITIENNIIKNVLSNGITIDSLDKNLLINNNQIIENRLSINASIIVDSGENSTISNNSIINYGSNFGSGIFYIQPTSTTISNNVIKNKDLGILANLGHSDKIVFTNNNILNSGNSGIAIYTKDALSTYNIDILDLSNNTIQNSGVTNNTIAALRFYSGNMVVKSLNLAGIDMSYNPLITKSIDFQNPSIILKTINVNGMNNGVLNYPNFINYDRISGGFKKTSQPVIGSLWVKGDIVYNLSPSTTAGTASGWINTSSTSVPNWQELSTIDNKGYTSANYVNINGFIANNTDGAANITGTSTTNSIRQLSTSSGVNFPNSGTGQLITFNGNGDASRSLTLYSVRSDLGSDVYYQKYNSSGVALGFKKIVTNDSPVFTGNPTAPTATIGTNTTQIATTASIVNALAGTTNNILKKTGTGALGDSNISDNGSIITLNADANLTGSTSFQGIVTANAQIRLKGYTVATLPTGTTGQIAYVTDATAPTYLGMLTGGGSVKCPVFYNGTNWVAQ